MKNTLLILLTCTLCFSSCGGGGKGPETASSFDVNFHNLLSNENVDGGIGIYYMPPGSVDPASGNFPYYPENIKILDPTRSTQIPMGVWDIYIVGFSGPGAFQIGSGFYCGKIPAATIDGESMVLTVQVSAVNCSNSSAMLDMAGAFVVHSKGLRVAQFDISTMDSIFAIAGF